MIDSLSIAMVMPELILTGAGLILLMVAAYAGDRATQAVNWLSVFSLLAAGLSIIQAPQGVAFDGLYRADAFSAFAKALIYISAAVSIIVAPRFFAQGGALRAEYPLLIVFSSVGMGMMVSAADLLTLYVGLELTSLSSYVLASFMRKDTRSAEAGLKYFVLGALASGILLYGMSLLYGFTGTTGFDGIATAMADGISNGELFGLVFVLAGLAFKISAVPFHMWTPDVYEGSPTPVTAFFASAPRSRQWGFWSVLPSRQWDQAAAPGSRSSSSWRSLRSSLAALRRSTRPISSACWHIAPSTMSDSRSSVSPPGPRRALRP